MIRFILVASLFASGCATTPAQRSAPGCWWQRARFDSAVPLFDTKAEVELGHVRSHLTAVPRFEGTLRTEGSHVLLEGTLEGERLVLYVSVDATKSPVLHVADRVRLGSAAMVLEGGPVLALALETGRALIGVSGTATAEFTPRKPAAVPLRCESLTLAGDHSDTPEVTRAGFTPGAPHLVDPRAEVVLHDTPNGEWSGTFFNPRSLVYPVETQDGWTRIVAPREGMVWVGWVHSSLITPGQPAPAKGSAPLEEDRDESKVVTCSHTVKLMINTANGERTVGELSPGAHFSVGVSRNGRHLIMPRIEWFVPAQGVHFFTDDDVSNCSEVSAP